MPKKAILTTIPSDSHNWNLIYMELLLEEKGFEVINLGPCTPFALAEEQCLQHKPDLVVVSTVNGHGYIEGREMIARLRHLPGMQETPVYIGGKLSTDASMSCLYAVELEQAGYSKVFYSDEGMGEFLQRLEHFFARQPQQEGVESGSGKPGSWG